MVICVVVISTHASTATNIYSDYPEYTVCTKKFLSKILLITVVITFDHMSWEMQAFLFIHFLVSAGSAPDPCRVFLHNPH